VVAKDGQRRLHEYCECISQCSKLGEPEEALKWFRKLREDESVQVSVAAFNAIIDSWAQRAGTKEVVALIEEMQEAGFAPDAITMNSVINAHAQVTTMRNCWYIIDCSRGILSWIIVSLVCVSMTTSSHRPDISSLLNCFIYTCANRPEIVMVPCFG
jgi:pentatricopeptide repeat protein